MSRLVTLNLPGIRAAQKALAEGERTGRRAHRRALRDTAKWAGRQAARGLAHANRLPLKALTRGRMGRRGRIRWDLREGSAGVWVGTAPVAASHLGKLSQSRVGARAGRRSFRGAFLATMPGGHKTGVFERKGASRLPIREVTVPLEGAEDVAAEVEGRIPDRYDELLRQAWRFESLRRKR